MAVIMDVEKLKVYLTKVCTEACVSEQRPVSFEYQFSVIEDRLLFAIKCSYNRIIRRVNYRLGNNLYKNFGLVYCNVRSIDSKIDFVPHDIDPNYSFAEWSAFGVWGTVRVGEDKKLNPHLHIGQQTKIKSLTDAGFPLNTFWNSISKDHDDWVEFLQYYEKAFGESLPVIKETYNVKVG